MSQGVGAIPNDIAALTRELIIARAKADEVEAELAVAVQEIQNRATVAPLGDNQLEAEIVSRDKQQCERNVTALIEMGLLSEAATATRYVRALALIRPRLAAAPSGPAGSPWIASDPGTILASPPRLQGRRS